MIRNGMSGITLPLPPPVKGGDPKNPLPAAGEGRVRGLAGSKHSFKLAPMGLDPGSSPWIPAFAGMTSKTPTTVSLLGFSTSDDQLDIILGNYYSYGSWHKLSCERSTRRLKIRGSTQRHPPGNQYGPKGHILISPHQLQLYQFQKGQERGDNVESGIVLLEK
jgi:hypothetical protein